MISWWRGRKSDFFVDAAAVVEEELLLRCFIVDIVIVRVVRIRITISV